MTDRTYSSSAQSGAGGLAAHAHWLLRVAVASVFLFHGIDKLANDGAFNFLAQGLGLGGFLTWLVLLGEIGTGLIVLAGGVGPALWRDAATRLAGLGVIGIMVGAIVLVHWPNWSFARNGMEFQVTQLLIGAYLLVRGRHA